MKGPLLTLVVFLSCFTSLVSSTALSFKLAPNEKTCFFAYITEKGAKVAFYFAVQSGGSFDVDYRVTGPNKVVLDGQKERQGDFVFTANDIGEYSFCFDNTISTVTEKMVDFEISVWNDKECSRGEKPRAIENEVRASLPARQGAPVEQTSLLSESIYKLSGQLSTITRNQKYFRTRENRNFSTVRSTENRIFKFSVIENLVMVGMAGLQVFVVKFFFQGARKGFV